VREIVVPALRGQPGNINFEVMSIVKLIKDVVAERKGVDNFLRCFFENDSFEFYYRNLKKIILWSILEATKIQQSQIQKLQIIP
jgi:hypothetical protein